jgi:hypothetical protein
MPKICAKNPMQKLPKNPTKIFDKNLTKIWWDKNFYIFLNINTNKKPKT